MPKSIDERVAMAAALKKKSRAWIAKELGMTPQNLGQKLKRGTLSAETFVAIYDLLGYKLIAVDKVTNEVEEGL